MARIFKQIDYYNLLCVIYKSANYNKEKSVTLYTYVCFQLLQEGFNKMYVEKLASDLNLISTNETENTFKISEKQYKTTTEQLNKLFNYHDLINFKSVIWDMVHRGYYE